MATSRTDVFDGNKLQSVLYSFKMEEAPAETIEESFSVVLRFENN